MPNNRVFTEKLTNGETVALVAVEIISVPHISIIDDRKNAISEVTDRYKEEISSLLGEIHQVYKDLSRAEGMSKDISFELLWTTQAVANQQYKAQIRLFLIVRIIDPDSDAAKASAERLMSLCKSTLDLQKYTFADSGSDELIRIMSQIDDSGTRAIVKEERVENLQNQLLPYCYAYDKFPESNSDLSRVINDLVEHPGCAVSMQLIPTYLAPAELSEIDRTTQLLDTLSNGVMDQGVGNVSFTLAASHAETYKYYARHKNLPLYLFNIVVYGGVNDASSIASKVFGMLSSESADLKIVSIGTGEIDKTGNFYPLPWALNELLQNRYRNAAIWGGGAMSPAYFRLPFIITGEEAAEFFRLPIGSDRVSAGLKINESEKGSKTYDYGIINAGDITVGTLKSSSNRDTIGFELRDLAKHMLVVGTPGSGKTTFSVSLLDRLWKEHNIPFLVIEPAKNEYRALIKSIPDLQIFTPGKNFISPFVFNPFVPPKNVKLETYKSTLKTAFEAGVSMSTPLDKIFEETINNCYSDFRWLDTYTSDDKGTVFNISDFVRCFQQTFDEIGYTGDARNIGRAGVVRLNSLVNLFDNYFSIPIEDLLKKPTVIELAAIENMDQKALIIALLLLSVLAYVNANYVGDGGLKNVILLEEAHVLLDADTNSGQGDANPSAVAQRLVKRMLAEIRSYGVGIIVADQSPRKVSTDVVALTDMKMVFRLVEGVDKQMIGDSMGMTDTQVQRLPKLKPGEAFLFFNKLDEPEEVVTPDYRLENNIDITLSDENIKQLTTYWNGKQDKLRPYPQCQYVRYCSCSCDYNRRVLAREVARRIFVKNIKSNVKDYAAVSNVFKHLSRFITAELNDEKLTAELRDCVRVHLLRKIRYSTKLNIPERLTEEILKKQ